MTETEKNTAWEDQAMSMEWTGRLLEVNAAAGPEFWMPPAQILGLIDFLTGIRDEVASAADAQAAAHLWRAAAGAAADLHPDVFQIDQGSMILANATGMDLEDAQRCLTLVLRRGADLPPGEVKAYQTANNGPEWRYVQHSPGLWVEQYVPYGGES